MSSCDNNASERLKQYASLILKEKRIRNITGAGSYREIYDNHIKQCMDFSKIIAGITGIKGIDVGSGNGMPGVVTAVCCPKKNIYLLDSSHKKINFLNMVKRKCSLENLFVIKGRAELIARMDEYRGSFDFVMSRALAPLKVSAELCIPFVKESGRYYVMSGRHYKKESEKAKKTITDLGAAVERLTSEGFIVIKKKRPTPLRYPRKWKNIS